MGPYPHNSVRTAITAENPPRTHQPLRQDSYPDQ